MGPLKTKPLRASLAALSSCLPRRPLSARVCSPEVASDATARAPPASAATRRLCDPGRDLPASLATEAENRASAAVETSWPAALSRAERDFFFNDTVTTE